MRVSSITPNVSFKRVTKEAAKHAFKEAKNENATLKTKEVASLIGKGFAATHYDVGFDKKNGKYTIYRNNEKPRGTTMLYGEVQETKSLAKAVELTLEKQEQQNEYLAQIAKGMDESNILSIFTVEDKK